MKKSVAVSSTINSGARGFAIALLIQSLDGSLSHSLFARLIPAYGFGVVRLSCSPTVVLLYKVDLMYSRRTAFLHPNSDLHRGKHLPELISRVVPFTIVLAIGKFINLSSILQIRVTFIG